jgi:hypothetical protein
MGYELSTGFARDFEFTEQHEMKDEMQFGTDDEKPS